MTNISKFVQSYIAAVSTQRECVAKLQAALAGKDASETRAALLPHVAAAYAVPVVDGKLDREAKKYEAARKMLFRLTAEVVGTSDANKTQWSFTRQELAAAKALLALCGGKQGAAIAAIKRVAK